MHCMGKHCTTIITIHIIQVQLLSNVGMWVSWSMELKWAIVQCTDWLARLITAGLASRISFAGIQLTTLTVHLHLKIADYAFAFDNVFAFDNADDAFTFANALAWQNNSFALDHAFMPHFDHALKVAHAFATNWQCILVWYFVSIGIPYRS